MTALESVVFSDHSTLKLIGDDSFWGCTKLTFRPSLMDPNTIQGIKIKIENIYRKMIEDNVYYKILLQKKERIFILMTPMKKEKTKSAFARVLKTNTIPRVTLIMIKQQLTYTIHSDFH